MNMGETGNEIRLEIHEVRVKRGDKNTKAIIPLAIQ
jgi:hypothetical protein